MQISNTQRQDRHPSEACQHLLLSIAEFHEELDGRVGLNTIYRLVRCGRIRSIRLGERKILIPASEVSDWPRRELERQA